MHYLKLRLEVFNGHLKVRTLICIFWAEKHVYLNWKIVLMCSTLLILNATMKITMLSCLNCIYLHIFHIQYSTEVVHNLTVEGTTELFSLFEKITALIKQKKKLQELMHGLEDSPRELLAVNVILDSALTSSCKWVS